MPHWPLLFDHRLHDETKISSQVAHQKTVNLALQGVGSHGAFTWGVLDRLLEDERLSFDGISATSAGAVNAVVLGVWLGGRRTRTSQERAAELLASAVGDDVHRHLPADGARSDVG